MTEPSQDPDHAEPEIIDAELVPTPTTTQPPVVPPASLPDPDYDDRGVPSLDYVRGKIEDRYATSVGSAELADETPQARSLAEQEAERAKKASDKLAEIRRSLGG